MGRQEWINNMIYFQARCRGYLMRRELKCVQAEYEDIVRELEGGVEHLSWRGQFIPKPHFTDADTDGAFFRYPQPKIRIQECPEDVEKEKERAGDETPCLQSEVLVPERDAEPSCGAEGDCRETSVPSGGDTEREGEAAEGALQMSDSILQHTPPMHTLLKGVAHTPEALKQHRNTLAMELLWIQQAIASRKKYLTLKQKMETS
ncbi:IQ domain-containing protein C isoform X2 [Ictalurus furcatus]|uniref:IQ domain-containing protein C isoform X2 n=1 Tax=Ictalurus furcatus TaxID=66913 RepID=UPI00234FF006|nr:IQ domain-containing protein C isoform X2 [Ictalurus furcatus]